MKYEEKILEYNKFIRNEKLQQNLEDFKSRSDMFKIDSMNLDEEVEKQSALYSYIGALWSKARSLRNLAKLELKVVEASLIREIKSRAGGGKGPTIQEIDSLVITDQRYIKAYADLIELDELVDQLDVDLTASDQKARMLNLMSKEINREKTLKGYVE